MILIDLLPPEYRQKSRTPVKFMAFVAASVAINCSLIAWWSWTAVGVAAEVKSELAVLKDTSEGLQAQVDYHQALESEMRDAGAFLFTGGLHGPDAATVVRRDDGELLVTDGPFAEAKEHIGGFYVIDAADLDEALKWAEKVVDTINRPIEVRPFFDTRGP